MSSSSQHAWGLYTTKSTIYDKFILKALFTSLLKFSSFHSPHFSSLAFIHADFFQVVSTTPSPSDMPNVFKNVLLTISLSNFFSRFTCSLLYSLLWWSFHYCFVGFRSTSRKHQCWIFIVHVDSLTETAALSLHSHWFTCGNWKDQLYANHCWLHHAKASLYFLRISFYLVIEKELKSSIVSIFSSPAWKPGSSPMDIQGSSSVRILNNQDSKASSDKIISKRHIPVIRYHSSPHKENISAISGGMSPSVLSAINLILCAFSEFVRNEVKAFMILEKSLLQFIGSIRCRLYIMVSRHSSWIFVTVE